MSKMIVDITDKEYIFEIDRQEIVRAERIGFRREEINSTPLTQLYLLWNVGLHKNQPSLSMTLTNSLFDKYDEEGGDTSEVIEFLSNEYLNFLQTNQPDTKKLKKARLVD